MGNLIFGANITFNEAIPVKDQTGNTININNCSFVIDKIVEKTVIGKITVIGSDYANRDAYENGFPAIVLPDEYTALELTDIVLLKYRAAEGMSFYDFAYKVWAAELLQNENIDTITFVEKPDPIPGDDIIQF